MSYIYTYTGKKVDPRDMHRQDVDILDVAHALSNLCRFTGHLRKFYSVAEHSVHVSYLVPEKHALWGLLHDASEAYIGDFNKPTKEHVPAYNQLEEKIIDRAIIPHFRLEPCFIPSCVHIADRQMGNNEMRDLFLGPKEQDPRWQPKESVFVDVTRPWPPGVARVAFLSRYAFLTDRRG